MPTNHKLKRTSKPFTDKQIADAINAAPAVKEPSLQQWDTALVTPGGGVISTIAELKRWRGKNKKPIKEPVAIRLDPAVLAAFRAQGPGWQSRINDVLKKWVSSQGA